MGFFSSCFCHKLKRSKRSYILWLGIILLLQFFGFWGFFYLYFCDNEDFELDYFDETYNDLKVRHSNIRPTNIVYPDDEKKLLCAKYPENLVGKLSDRNETHKLLPWNEIISANSKIVDGGSYSPTKCRSRNRVAIIIPLRGREEQLRVLLSYMHPIWQRQEMDYTVYTITQSGNGLFNRAKLINTGVAEAMRDREYDCFVFHDVDLLLESDKCLYWCDNSNPRHLAMYMDKFSYKPLIYSSPCVPHYFIGYKIPYFGGVSMMTKDQFTKINGFSNLYWGWGGEDDDVYFRLHKKGYSIANPYGNSCSYHMIKHEHESSNAENDGRYALLFHSASRMDKEGFNTLQYKVVSKDLMPLYTNITVDIGKPKKKMAKFMSRVTPWRGSCLAHMPWC